MQFEVGIVGTGHYLPEEVLTNQDLEKIVDTSDEWIKVRTGIRERRIARAGISTSYLATQAAKKALQSAQLKSDQIELIIVATITPDMLFPATACFVQAEIGAKKAFCFDLEAACAGFLFALHTGEQFVRNGVYKNALIIAADKMSSIVDWEDRNTCVLFGDGAGACVITRSEEKKILGSQLGSNGELAEIVCVPGGGSKKPFSREVLEERLSYLRMDGRALFKQAVPLLETVSREVVLKCGLSLEDIRLYIPHQANIRIIEAVAKRLKIPMEKVFLNLHRYGNVSAASVAIGLDEVFQKNELARRDKVLLAAIGAGLSWAAAVIEW